MTLTAGVTYTIQTSSDGTGTDAYLNIRDATGATILAFDDDGGDSVNSLISFTATTSGVYFIDAGNYNDDTTGSYHLFVAAAVPLGDSVAGTTATAATLAVAGTTNGNIDSDGDHDFYAITLTAGQTYIFRTAGTAASDTTNTVLTLRDASGALLETNDNAGQGNFSAVRYTATTTGTYYVDVSGSGTATGAFNLTAFVTQPLVLYTNDQIAFQLTNTYWGGTARRFNVTTGGTITYNIAGLTAEGVFLAREALNLWSGALGITFSEVTSGGQLVFDDAQTGAFASSTRSGGFITQSNINVGTEWITTYGATLRTYSFQTYVHEIGHALGLGHAGPYNGSATYGVDNSYQNDSWATSVMSYFDQTENDYFSTLGFTRQLAVSPIVADIVATTSLYGTATTTRTGSTTYGFNNTSGREIYLAVVGQSALTYTIVDHGGTDTLDYSGYTAAQRINLNAETFSNVGGRVGNVSIARGTIIENAIGGSGADVLFGNAAANVLTGGLGNDSYFVDSSDRVIETAGGGYDIVYASANFTLGAGAEVEVLGTINNTATTAINLTGNELNNYLTGNAGSNLLDGRGGSDYLDGRGGNDSYFVDSGDIVLENAGGGYDIVYASASFTLGAGAEVEVLGTINNTATTAINLTGNELNNYLIGNAGSNLLDGRGGSDYLDGRGGNDSYYVDSGDIVLENAGGGYDIVYASSNFTLGAGMEIEVLGTVDNTATTAINLTGNELNNYLTGNAGANVFYGLGGRDYLVGRGGNDSYYVDSGDIVLENAGEGYDTIYTNTDYTLPSGAEVEVLGTINNTATTAINLFGNQLNNYLTGNAGSNLLDGAGGNDYLVGRSGNDSYYVDSGDTVLENAGDGYDIVYASANFTLGAGAEVEVLGTINNTATTAITLTGNELNNYLTGNAGANILNGAGGNDYLNGRGGNDIFLFGAASGADVITDFAQGQDKIDLSALGLTFAQVQAGYVQQGVNGTINLGGGNSVTLLNVTLANLTQSDFILAAAAEALPKGFGADAVSASIAIAFVNADNDQLFGNDAGDMEFIPQSLNSGTPMAGDFIL